ncbi:lipase maturation factor, putative [Plasmodium vivax]|uniref:Lipase maturation factor 2 n=1 Tax=Plasmodium vivax TaxID=5855 RepID=A0A564ZSS1_PLAVI|nr:lipase maturation factor, putative [Plasmodium vivax]
MDAPYNRSSIHHKNIKKNNSDTFKLKKKNCVLITCFIFYIFFLSTVNSLDKYLHLRTSRFILTYSNLLYLVSFFSLHSQVELLIGLQGGILPIDKFLREVKKKLRSIDLFLVHHVVRCVYQFWKFVIRRRIKVKTFCKVGVFLSIANFLIQENVQNDFVRITFSSFFFVSLFILHLCFKIGMRDFMVFQCDLLMNELGFLLIFLCLSDSHHLRHSNTLVICALRLVAFKILFGSAVHKLVYNSPQWLHLEACQNLFFCQPAPSILSHIANCTFNKKIICFLVLTSELLLSWLIFCSSILRLIFFTLFVTIHITCYIICNYIFFSYLCLILFLSSLDDSILNLFFHPGEIPVLHENGAPPNTVTFLLVGCVNLVILLFYALIVLINLVPFVEQWNVDDLKCFHLCYHIFYELFPLNICNSYAMLTYTRTHREEIIIEELHKIGKKFQWKSLNFGYKAGDLNEIGPILWWGHVPRLEWKFYFFADQIRNEKYERGRYPLYVCSFLKKLCSREGQLASLFEGDQMRRVPYFLRLTSYDYKMSMTVKSRQCGSTPPRLRANPPSRLHERTLLIHPDEKEQGKPTTDSNLEEEPKWEFGKYWLRRKVRVIKTLRPLGELSD